jgi:hypothetical protein
MASELGLQRANHIGAWIGEHVGGVAGPSSNRHRAAGASFMACIAHFHSVCLLVRHPVGNGSAFALARVVWESYVNGAFLWSSAKDDLIERFVHAERPLPKLPAMVKELRKHPVYKIGTLSNIQTQAEKALNSYTHGGALAVQRWVTGDSIEPTFTDEEVDEVLEFTSRIAIFAALGVAQVVESVSLAEATAAFFKGQEHLVANSHPRERGAAA